jgi:hypothetical protein
MKLKVSFQPCQVYTDINVKACSGKSIEYLDGEHCNYTCLN